MSEIKKLITRLEEVERLQQQNTASLGRTLDRFDATLGLFDAGMALFEQILRAYAADKGVTLPDELSATPNESKPEPEVIFQNEEKTIGVHGPFDTMEEAMAAVADIAATLGVSEADIDMRGLEGPPQALVQIEVIGTGDASETTVRMRFEDDSVETVSVFDNPADGVSCGFDLAAAAKTGVYFNFVENE